LAYAATNSLRSISDKINGQHDLDFLGQSQGGLKSEISSPSTPSQRRRHVKKGAL
jgi:hypothetical protein